ncbi:uncharacterized protein LOC115409346 [Salarias fasciatus]|uniref:uncharacterized protein LOC115409346 n=1 Tax=Salarias fasciatus TaxID=181472 RepID=UPI001176E4B6|nr:uncharacterized protein LOC115409346 [Salarias fasciatus]
MHVSIFLKTSLPQVSCCTTCCKQYHCPICPKLKSFPLPKFDQHMAVHVKNAVDFQDMFICRCNLPCRDPGHFHCPLCDRTVIRRMDMESHLKLCSAQCLPASNEQIPSPHQPSVVSPTSSSKDAPVPVVASPSTAASPVSPPPSPKAALASIASSFSLTSSPPQDTSTQVTPEPQHSKTPKAQYKQVKCPVCSLTLYQKNFQKHMKRKHTEGKEITAQDHLKSVCVDATNGISAVKRNKHGSSVPIHVQSKTWGHVHKVQCELEECRQYHLLAVRSGLASKHCEHIRSLQYCTDTAQEECLKEETLTAMVQQNILEEAKKVACLKRQSQAQASHVPLCVQVNLQDTQGRFSFLFMNQGCTITVASAD